MTRRGALGRASPGEPKVDGKILPRPSEYPDSSPDGAARGMRETPERAGMLESECKTQRRTLSCAQNTTACLGFPSHLAQVHSLVSPCQLVRLVDLDVAPRAQRALSLKQNTVAGALWQSAHCTMAPARTRTENPTRTLAAAPSTRAPDYRARHARDISEKNLTNAPPLGHLSSPADALHPRWRPRPLA